MSRNGQPAPRNFINKVVLRGDVRKMCNGHQEIHFHPGVNILVGPNGSGKSTILRVLRDRDWAAMMDCEIWKELDGNVDWVAFDGEQDNPRFRKGGGPLQFVSTVGSHGEVQKRVLAFLNGRVYPGMAVLMDEPEAALDTDGVRLLFALVQQRQDLQWIIASHHPLVWKLPGARVIELTPGHVQETMAVWKQIAGL